MGSRPAITCPHCGKRVLVDGVLTARVVRLGTPCSQARCNRCKRWMAVPVVPAAAHDFPLTASGATHTVSTGSGKGRR